MYVTSHVPNSQIYFPYFSGLHLAMPTIEIRHAHKNKEKLPSLAKTSSWCAERASRANKVILFFPNPIGKDEIASNVS